MGKYDCLFTAVVAVGACCLVLVVSTCTQRHDNNQKEICMAAINAKDPNAAIICRHVGKELQ